MATNIYSLIIVLGVLVFFHEFGHFLFARLFGVGVEKFSLGFGPKLFGKKIGMTDYMVSAIPLGGYVKMVGEDPESELTEEEIPLSFTHKPVWQRFIIVAAGPVFNYILAVLIFFIMLFITGDEGLSPVIGEMEQGSPSVSAGLMSGDRIIKVNDADVVLWSDIAEIIENSGENAAEFTVLRGEREKKINVVLTKKKATDLLGDEQEIFYWGASPFQKITISGITPNSPASAAGLLKGDRITSVNKEELKSWGTLVNKVMDSKGAAIEFGIRRGEKEFSISIKPEIIKNNNQEIYRVGIERGIETIKKNMGLISSFSASIVRTYRLSDFMIRALGKIITGKISKSELGGPIMIAQMAGDNARAGIDKLISFIALISINLAILNFLPIPILDGGHLLFFTIEIIKGSPVSLKTRAIAQQTGMVILLMLMIYVFYNDLHRVFSG